MTSYNNFSRIDANTSTIYSLETTFSRTIKFILLFIAELGSICCSLFVLFNLILKRTLRRALHNHTIITLVAVSFSHNITDLPMLLDYLRRGYALSSTFCLMWNFFGWSNYAIGIWTTTWASFERHLLVFHSHLINTFRTKIFFHYIPLSMCIIIPWNYYVFLVFFYPCTNIFYQSILFCGFCCYAYNDQLVFFNWFAFGVIPTSLITVFSISLIVRMIAQKRRVQRRFQWRRYRFMVIQLLSISFLCMFYYIPTIILWIIQIFLPRFGNDIQMLYLYYIGYLWPSLTPFFCLSTLQELWVKKRERVFSPMLLRDTHVNRLNKRIKSIEHVPERNAL